MQLQSRAPDKLFHWWYSFFLGSAWYQSMTMQEDEEMSSAIIFRTISRSLDVKFTLNIRDMNSKY